MKTILDCAACENHPDTCNSPCLDLAATPVSTDAPTPEGSSRPHDSNADKSCYRHQGVIKMIDSYLEFSIFVLSVLSLFMYLLDRPFMTSTQRILAGALRIRSARLDELNGIEGKSL